MRSSLRLLIGLVPLASALACATADVAMEGILTRVDLAGHWIEVSEHQGKAMILAPCDASVRSIRLRGDVLEVGWGQEATEYTVRSARAAGEMLELEVTAQGSGDAQTVQARRTPRGVLWKLEDSEFDTVQSEGPAATKLPRMKECCASTEADPVPHRVSVVPQDEACP
jgi:hypothetical protein